MRGTKRRAGIIGAVMLAVACAPDASATPGYIAVAGPNEAYGTSPIGSGSGITFPGTDAGTATFNLPFAVRFYDRLYASGTPAHVSIDGNLQFGAASTSGANTTLPTTVIGDFIAPLWDDLSIANAANQEGVRIVVSGATGSSVMEIEWRAHPFACCDPTLAFKLKLYENQRSFRIVYASSASRGSATIGMQRGIGAESPATQWSFDTPTAQTVIDFHPLATVTTGGLGVPASKTNANVTGTVNPDGLPNNVEFRLGTSPGNLDQVLVVGTPQNGTNDIPLSATFAGLTPATTYYYRMKATQADHGGVSEGQIRSFVTDGASTTSMVCSPDSVAVGGVATCSATVSDLDGGATTMPTGSVAFSTDGAGSFPNGGTCALTATASPGVATCSVAYSPSGVGSGTHVLTGTYGGDADHASSSASDALGVTAAIALNGTTPAGGTGPAVTRASVNLFRVSPLAFRAAARGASAVPVPVPRRRVRASARAIPTFATVTYRLNLAARASFRVQRALPGRLVSRACRRQTRANRGRPRCTHWVYLPGSFTHAGAAGTNRFRFTGRLRGRKLAVGRYRLRIVAGSGAVVSAPGVSPSFRILAPARRVLRGR